MEISQIKTLWTHPVNDRQANLAAWDILAEHYTNDIHPPDWDSSPFLKQVKSEVPLTKEMSVLDIGCGIGAYSFAIAEKVEKVVGIDLSPKMLARAETVAKERNITNVSFICADFNDVVLEEKFDLVFAHMTPAVADATTFEKMLSYASGYCYLIKPVHRTDPVLDQLRKIVGNQPRPGSFDKGILYAFMILWQMDILPTLCYRPDVWNMSKSVEEAAKWYLSRLRTYHTVDEAAEKRVLEYLNGIVEEGMVHETVNTTIATMGWRMDEDNGH